MQELKRIGSRLLLRGIETQYKYKGQTLERQGVSFKLGEYSFKGSQVDRQFSLGNLEKALVLNKKERITLSHGFVENMNHYSLKAGQHDVSTGAFKENLQENPVSKALEKSLDILLRPHETDRTPRELLEDNTLKKKKKRSRGLHH